MGVADRLALEVREANELVVMDCSLNAIAELDAIRMSAIDWRSNDDANRPGRMSDPVIGGHHVFLCDNLGTGGIDQWYVLHCKIEFLISLNSVREAFAKSLDLWGRVRRANQNISD